MSFWEIVGAVIVGNIIMFFGLAILGWLFRGIIRGWT